MNCCWSTGISVFSRSIISYILPIVYKHDLFRTSSLAESTTSDHLEMWYRMEFRDLIRLIIQQYVSERIWSVVSKIYYIRQTQISRKYFIQINSSIVQETDLNSYKEEKMMTFLNIGVNYRKRTTGSWWEAICVHYLTLCRVMCILSTQIGRQGTIFLDNAFQRYIYQVPLGV